MQKHLKSLVTKSFQRLGYTIVANRRLDRLPQTRYLARLFSLLSIDCVFDVGANKGQYGRFLRDEVGYTGTIVSFEPVPASLAALRAVASGDSKWQVEPCALGRVAGTATFNVMANSVFSSFLTPDHSRLSRFRTGNRVEQTIEVEVATLDSMFPRIAERTGCTAPYLKMDTQGFDLDVAAGGQSVIREFRGLQSEASVTPIYEGMPNFAQSIETFREMGFDLSAMFHLNPTGHFPRMIEFDCHMINRAYLPPDKQAVE